MDHSAGAGPSGTRRRCLRAAARGEAAGLLQRLARVLPQLRRSGWPGAADASAAPEPAPDHRSRGGDALAALAREGRRADRVVAGERPALEEDRLGDRAQPPGRQPPLAIRHRADHLATQWTRAARATIAALRGRERRPAVKENRLVIEFSGRHRTGFTDSRPRATNGIYSGEARAAHTAAAGFRGPPRGQPGSRSPSHCFPVPFRAETYAGGRGAKYRQRQGRFFGKPPESGVHPRRPESLLNSNT